MKTPLQVAAFVRRHWSMCRMWPRENLIGWVQWFMGHDLAVILMDKGRICGVAFARLCRNTDLMKGKQYLAPEHFIHDPMGDTVFVDLAISRGTAILRSMAAFAPLMFRNHSPRWIAWGREKRDGAPRRFSYRQFSRRL